MRAKTGGASKAVPLPLSDFDEARGRWRSEVQAGPGAADNPKNRSGIDVKALYTPQESARSASAASHKANRIAISALLIAALSMILSAVTLFR